MWKRALIPADRKSQTAETLDGEIRAGDEGSLTDLWPRNTAHSNIHYFQGSDTCFFSFSSFF